MAKFDKISKKQSEIFAFLQEPYDALICDGAVRSGKTVLMSVAFLEWAMHSFENGNFAICGKTVRSAERNILSPLLSMTSIVNRYQITYRRSDGLLNVKEGRRQNHFYLFGGKDESSYMLIQGITLCGVLFDEVALMPRSFVEQALTRTLSIKGAKYWFNCNPQGPDHWFYQEWILKAEQRNAKRIHFTLEDNPALDAKSIAKAKAQFSGVFYNRYILGEWKAVQGLVYPMFSQACITSDQPEGLYYLSVDYGTVNPFSAGLWSVGNDRAVRVAELYYDSKRGGGLKTDEEYYEMLESLVGNKRIQFVVVDPSAASFIECIRRGRRWLVKKAVNRVMDGIRITASMLASGKLQIHESCRDSIREFSLYRWDEKESEDRVCKENDHAMDEIRYFCNTVLIKEFRWENWK